MKIVREGFKVLIRKFSYQVLNFFFLNVCIIFCLNFMFYTKTHKKKKKKKNNQSYVLHVSFQVMAKSLGQNGQMPFSCKKNQRFAHFPKLIKEMPLF